MKYDLKSRQRRSIRLKGYDYSQPGAYFVTVCAFKREEIFGTIVNDAIQLSSLGKIVEAEWFRSSKIRKEIRLHEDEFVIMPNHLHSIVWIIDSPVGADGIRPDDVHPEGRVNTAQGAHTARPYDETRQMPRRVPKSLGSFIAGFKAAVTSRAGKELNSANIWQRNYYEHIVRNEAELKKIWEYIASNPTSCQEDQLHPAILANQFNQDNP